MSKGEDPAQILDLGCGAGVLAIAAAMVLDRKVVATDIDQDAVDVTAQNAAVNNVENMVEAYQADGFDSPSLSGKIFDLIFANILAGPLMGLAPDIAKAMNVEAYAILSGILDEQAATVAHIFEAEGLTVTAYPSLNGWTSLLAQKPK
jgi:ribosomal protein L11 methyltransferase